MKLRVRYNAVRLRLSQSEVARLRDSGIVEERIEFGPGQRLGYRITADPDASVIAAECRNGNIEVCVPKAMVATWADSSQVGMQMDQRVGDGQSLRLLIEKDFKCLDPADSEENVDTFPNPLEGGVC
jgi:hypothetical protein